MKEAQIRYKEWLESKTKIEFKKFFLESLENPTVKNCHFIHPDELSELDRRLKREEKQAKYLPLLPLINRNGR